MFRLFLLSLSILKWHELPCGDVGLPPKCAKVSRSDYLKLEVAAFQYLQERKSIPSIGKYFALYVVTPGSILIFVSKDALFVWKTGKKIL